MREMYWSSAVHDVSVVDECTVHGGQALAATVSTSMMARTRLQELLCRLNRLAAECRQEQTGERANVSCRLTDSQTRRDQICHFRQRHAETHGPIDIPQ
jgi:hypothetical protein